MAHSRALGLGIRPLLPAEVQATPAEVADPEPRLQPRPWRPWPSADPGRFIAQCTCRGVAKIEVDHGRCISCAGCVGVCPVDTITLKELYLTVEQGPCISCGLCVQMCPVGALTSGKDYGAAPTAKINRVVLV